MTGTFQSRNHLIEPKNNSIRKTAFLVIHGIGEQNPFETLDSFGQGMFRELARRVSPNGSIEASHRISKRKDSPGNMWNESYLHIVCGGDRTRQIDVHEMYWAYLAEEKISYSEVINWVKATIRGAGKFADENIKLAALVEQPDDSREHDEYRKYVKKLAELQGGKRYWHRLSGIIWAVRFGYPVALLVEWLMSWLANSIPQKILSGIPFIGSFVSTFLESAGSWASLIIRDYVGDVALYTCTDMKSKYFAVRQHILGASYAMLRDLAENGGYHEIVVVGHSLGSVIAYDTLNRVDLELGVEGGGPVSACGCIKGLVTLGSPLDKIVFFFREEVGKEESLRRQILSQLHLFKIKWPAAYEALTRRQTDIVLKPPFQSSMSNQVLWINYYSDLDPVSGHLDYYDLEEKNNLRLVFDDGTKHGKRWGEAHLAYWYDPKMYKDIVDAFIESPMGKREYPHQKENVDRFEIPVMDSRVGN